MDATPGLKVPYERLEAVGHQLNADSDSDSWCLVWLGMVGVCYALADAEPFLDTTPDLRLRQKQALAILSALGDSSTAAAAEVDNWMCGFHLNSAEIRIQSVFHRLLKTFCDREGDTVYADELVRDILQPCTQCAATRVTDEDALAVLNGFQRDVASGPGSALRSVWKRANAFKHSPEHKPDHDDPKLRRNTLVEALNELVAVYSAFRQSRSQNTAT